jgi:hypothetical protein
MERSLELQGLSIGVLSALSGAAMVVAPATMCRLYALPERYGRLIGVRDIAIGVVLLRNPRSALGFAARSISDAIDVALMVGTRKPGRHIAGRVIGGAVSAIVAARCATRAASSPA